MTGTAIYWSQKGVTWQERQERDMCIQLLFQTHFLKLPPRASQSSRKTIFLHSIKETYIHSFLQTLECFQLIFCKLTKNSYSRVFNGLHAYLMFKNKIHTQYVVHWKIEIGWISSSIDQLHQFDHCVCALFAAFSINQNDNFRSNFWNLVNLSTVSWTKEKEKHISFGKKGAAHHDN